MAQVDVATGAVRAERCFARSRRRVFEAFERGEALARWWGPAGFTNTFEVFEFRPGGRWVYVMHGPKGANYPNESIFREVERDSRIVIEHVVKPAYRLTVTLTPREGATRLTWEQVFLVPVTEKMLAFCATANEQNLDRLEAVLAEVVAEKRG